MLVPYQAMKMFAVILLLVGIGDSQLPKNPAARTHVKMVNGVYTKFTSKLQTIVELNFTLGFSHQPGKKVITDALSRIVAAYGNLKINKFASAADGSVVGVVPSFTVNDLMAGEVIVANNIGDFGGLKLKSQQTAIQSAIETHGRGYLGFHGSGENQATTWSWFSKTLFPLEFQGHGQRSLAPVYKHIATARHLVMDGILLSNTDSMRVPNELDALGADEVLSPVAVPTRKIRNEWFRFGRDISRDIQFKENVTLLLKGDTRDLNEQSLTADYKRKGGNIYSFLYKVGAGVTSYIPAGHENDELLDPKTGFDGGVRDFERYVAQTLFFLAGYHQSSCDSSCLGLPLVDENNLIVSPAIGDSFPTALSSRAFAQRAAIQFKNSTMGFISASENGYEVAVLNLQGKIFHRQSGFGRTSYDYPQENLNSGVYFLKVRIGNNPPQIKRYVILPFRTTTGYLETK